jgi:predicted nucleotidyltransferase
VWKTAANIKEFRLKHFFQRLAVRTQFFPFVYLYRALYTLAIRFCTRRLRKIRGVSSIYLRRGLTTGRPLYGLSDIDLLIMINGDNRSRVAERVRYQYELLRRFVPMLPEGELELYEPRQFRLLHEYSPFYRHRFEQGRREWRRLWGEDVFEDLSPASDDFRLLALQELSPAWYYLAQELLMEDVRPAYVRRYVAYKAIAEAARAALVAQGEDPRISRETALSLASEKYFGVSRTLREAQSLRKTLLSPEPIPVDALLESYLLLARKAQAAMPDGAEVRRKVRIQPLLPEAFHPFSFEKALSEIVRACTAVEEVERAVLMPRLNFDPLGRLGMDLGELAGATVDALDLVLIGRRLPPLDKLRTLTAALDRLQPWVNGFFCDRAVAVSLRPIQGCTVKIPDWTPEFFASLSSARPMEGVLELASIVEVDRPLRGVDSLDRRAHTLLALFEEPEIFRISTRSFFTLFWEAGRATWLATQARRPDIIEVPISSEQIVEALIGFTPDLEVTLRLIFREYCLEAEGRASEAVRYINWARWYALKLQEDLFSSGLLASEHAPRVKTELTISVAIVTRNRAQLLGAALQSLIEQERPPDQVVVVDNASSDETPTVADSFATRLNLTLVREERIGIPFARNTALKYCTGDIVAVMDDDCVAWPQWLKELEIPFLKDPYIGAVGGSVVPLEGQRELAARFYGSRMNHGENRARTHGS